MRKLQQKTTLNKGLFITFEGGEGAGKSTAILRVRAELEGKYPVVCTREPGGTILGEEIRALLLQHRGHIISPWTELCLILAARAQHIQEKILPALERQEIVLCDRFTDSTLAYQAGGRSLPFDQVEKMSSIIADRVKPDYTFYFDLDPRLGLQRMSRRNGHQNDRIESEEFAFHERVRETFLAIAKKEPNRICVIDATLDRERVFQTIWSQIQCLLES